MTFDCFGLIIHGYSADEAMERINWMNARGEQAMVVTANAEILLAAKRDPRYWNVLRQADLRLVDSAGLQWVGRFSGLKPHRVPGVAFAERLLEEAAERAWRVALIGAAPGVAEQAAWALRKRFPDLTVQAEEGGRVGPDGQPDDAGQEALQRLTQFGPHLLLVAFGHPKQESWLVDHLKDLPSVKIAVGVGGSFDYWSGRKKRAPAWMQRAGLEWLYRALREPSRIGRIADAVLVFPFLALADKFFPSKDVDSSAKNGV